MWYNVLKLSQRQVINIVSLQKHRIHEMNQSSKLKHALDSHYGTERGIKSKHFCVDRKNIAPHGRFHDIRCLNFGVIETSAFLLVLLVLVVLSVSLLHIQKDYNNTMDLFWKFWHFGILHTPYIFCAGKPWRHTASMCAALQNVWDYEMGTENDYTLHYFVYNYYVLHKAVSTVLQYFYFYLKLLSSLFI